MFPTSTYQNRRQALLQALPDSIILLLGNELSSRNFKDNTYPFRQDSTFLYYTGINREGLALLIDCEKGTSTLFGDNLSIEQRIWSEENIRLEEYAALAGISHYRRAGELAAYLNDVLKQKRTLHFLPPYRPENKHKLSEFLSIPYTKITESSSIPLIKAVVSGREIKDANEIQEIENAVSTSIDMHLLALRMAKPGITELTIANAIQQLAQDAGGALAYPSIVTTNGQILHNHEYSNHLKEGDLLLNDSGAETALGYAGDLTRTFPVSKQFTSLQKNIYSVVLNAFEEACLKLIPGEKYLNIHLQACISLTKGLKELGLMKGDADAAVAAGAHALFFPCGTGHMLGLDVHDMEDLGEEYVGYTPEQPKNLQSFGLKSLRLGKKLEKGNVLTVEPGIYFIPALIDQWASERRLEQFINYSALDSFKNFGGIRIEDNFLITERGHKVFGKPLAKTLSEIEEIRYSAF